MLAAGLNACCTVAQLVSLPGATDARPQPCCSAAAPALRLGARQPLQQADTHARVGGRAGKRKGGRARVCAQAPWRFSVPPTVCPSMGGYSRLLCMFQALTCPAPALVFSPTKRKPAKTSMHATSPPTCTVLTHCGPGYWGGGGGGVLGGWGAAGTAAACAHGTCDTPGACAQTKLSGACILAQSGLRHGAAEVRPCPNNWRRRPYQPRTGQSRIHGQ